MIGDDLFDRLAISFAMTLAIIAGICFVGLSIWMLVENPIFLIPISIFSILWYIIYRINWGETK